MTLNEFRQFSNRDRAASRTYEHPHRIVVGTPTAIGSERTNPPSRTKASMVRGFTPTCNLKKAISRTQLIGTVGQVSPFVENRSIWNDSA